MNKRHSRTCKIDTLTIKIFLKDTEGDIKSPVSITPHQMIWREVQPSITGLHSQCEGPADVPSVGSEWTIENFFTFKVGIWNTVSTLE